jgi:hypothetical protein
MVLCVFTTPGREVLNCLKPTVDINLDVVLGFANVVEFGDTATCGTLTLSRMLLNLLYGVIATCETLTLS